MYLRETKIVPNYSKYLLERMQSFLDNKDFCDVEIVAQKETRLPAHRLVLAASSDYFYDLITDKTPCLLLYIETEMYPDICEAIIDFCYTGEIELNEYNVFNIIRAANDVELRDVVSVCEEFLRSHMVKEESCLRLLQIAEEYNLSALREDAVLYAALHFSKISRSEKFLDLSASLLESIMECEELDVRREEDAFQDIKRWYEHDENVRGEFLAKLLDVSLKWTELDDKFILEHISPLPGCAPLALNILKRLKDPHDVVYKQTSPRRTLLAISMGGNSPIDFPSFSSYDLLTSTWHALPSVPNSCVSMTFAQLSDDIYVIGGENKKRPEINAVQKFNMNTGKWCSVSSMGIARSEAAAVVLDNKIYVFGGNCNGSGDVIIDKTMYYTFESKLKENTLITECYDPVKNTWERVADMNEPRYSPGAVATDTHIYAIGGSNECEELKTAECYDPLTNKWRYISPLNFTCEKICAVFFNNRLLAISGNYTKDLPSAAREGGIQEYDFERNVWKTLPFPYDGTYDCVSVPTSIAQKLKTKTISDPGWLYDKDIWHPSGLPDIRSKHVELLYGLKNVSK